MAKASIPGTTKTRLTPPLSAHEAAHFNTCFLRDIADNMLDAATVADIAGYMAYAPAGSAAFFRAALPPSIGLIEAVAPNFGDCLFHAASRLFAAGHRAAGLLNSDSPTLPSRYLVDAANALARPGERVVIGPSTDGGYYFLGLKAPHRRLFEDIAWSTRRVFEQTLRRAAEIGLDLVVLPEWYDVDDADGLRQLTGELVHGQPFRTVNRQAPSPGAASGTATRRYLAELFETSDLERRLGLDFSARHARSSVAS